MALDTSTLITLLGAQLLLLGVALPVMADLRGSMGLRWGIAGLWAQMGAVVCFGLASGIGTWFTAAALVLMALTYAMGVQAMTAWLGPRPLQKLAWALPVLMAVLLLLGPVTPEVWQGWANLILVLVQGLMVLALLWPSPQAPAASWRWRGLLALPITVVAVLTAWRGSYAFDRHGRCYPALKSAHPLAMAVLLTGNLATILSALGACWPPGGGRPRWPCATPPKPIRSPVWPTAVP